MNLLYYGGNLSVMPGDVATASADLIYQNPPNDISPVGLTTSATLCYTPDRYHCSGPGRCRKSR